jgi:hypothetical protein
MKTIKKYQDFRNINEKWEDEDEYSVYDGDGDDQNNSEEEVDFDGEMDYLCQTIESLFDNSGINCNVTNQGLDITAFVFPEKKESIKTLTKIFDVANKLRKDILPQYNSEFEIYEQKDGYPVITFQFTYEEEGTKSKVPWKERTF